MAEALIADRYRLENRLGVGGMSTVHLAFDTRLERPVAVKLLAEHLAEDPSFVSRFQREAQSAARLIHPNVVQVFDSGLDDRRDRHYIVMELVNGPSCAEMLRDRKRLEVDETLDIISQACRGLDYAHRHGVVHRDVKPGNLLRNQDGVVKLADFGIAKAAEQSSITQVGSVLGTAAYLAPEQARGEEAGPPSDVYSLGVVTYQLLAGRVPYEAASLTELAMKQQNESPPPLDELNPEVRPSLAEAVERALHTDPGARYDSALAMGEALRAGERGLTPPPAPGETEVTAIAPGRLEDPDATEATEYLTRQPAPPAPVRRREPRRARPAPAAAAPAPVAEAPPRRPPRRRRRAGALILPFLLLALIVGGLAAFLIAETGSDSGRRIEDVVLRNVADGVDDLKQFIDDNTR